MFRSRITSTTKNAMWSSGNPYTLTKTNWRTSSIKSYLGFLQFILNQRNYACILCLYNVSIHSYSLTRFVISRWSALCKNQQHAFLISTSNCKISDAHIILHSILKMSWFVEISFFYLDRGLTRNKTKCRVHDFHILRIWFNCSLSWEQDYIILVLYNGNYKCVSIYK